MIWAIGVSLVVIGALLIIFAMQDKWPIAPFKLQAPPPEPVGPHPGAKPPEPYQH
jgi:hypothetical protein